MLVEAFRRAWLRTSSEQLHRSQRALLDALVESPLVPSTRVLNAVDTANWPSTSSRGPRGDGHTVVLAHGFGSGLGFFFRNVDALLASPKVDRVVLVDWLGMGGSDRPSCRAAPRVPLFGCDSGLGAAGATSFFVDAMEGFCELHDLRDFTLVGHSLGGLLSARFAMQHPGRVRNLVLASPVGFPLRPADALPNSDLPNSLRLVDALWSANVTPQQLARTMGHARGIANVRRVLAMRLRALDPAHLDLLADYMWHITAAPASGEFAMNSLLTPVSSPGAMGVFAREPLQEDLAASLDVQRLLVLFGEDDWMRPNGEASARVAAEALRTRQPSGLGADAPSLGPMDAEVAIVPAAGHHLYMDNVDDFNERILRVLQ